MMNIFKKKQYQSSKAKIKEIYDVGAKFSSEASKVARQLAFGEGAIFWFFFHHVHKLMPVILIGLSFLVLYFIFDISQYIIGAWLNKNLGKTYENLNIEDSPIDPEKISRPTTFNNPVYFCYYAKFILLSISSFILMSLFLSLLIP